MSQLFHAFDERDTSRSFFTRGLFSNRWLWLALGVGALLQWLVITVPPFAALFEVFPLVPLDWAIAVGLALVPVVVNETVKVLIRMRRALECAAMAYGVECGVACAVEMPRRRGIFSNVPRARRRSHLCYLLLPALGVLVAGCSEVGLFDDLAARYAEFDWAYAVHLEIDAVGAHEALDDVPLLVRLTPERVHYEAFRLDGRDLEFRDPATDEPVPHEVQRWEPGGESLVWVRLPAVEPGERAGLVMLYGRYLPGEGDDPAAVWSNGYVGVWHLDESGPPYADSTDNGNHALTGSRAASDPVDPTLSATELLVAPEPVEGHVGGALDFSLAAGARAGIWVPAPGAIPIDGPLSIEFLIRGGAEYDTDFLFFKNTLTIRADFDATHQTLRFEHEYTDSIPMLRQHKFVWGADAWTSAVFTWDGTNAGYSSVFYADGEEPGISIHGRGATGERESHADDPLVIGNGGWGEVLTRAFDGMLDEVRIAGIARSQSWARFQTAVYRDEAIRWDEARESKLR
ncbi:MAG: cation transporting ATPase C-terminal domain-containing protein [Spirochaetota bacterium]